MRENNLLNRNGTNDIQGVKLTYALVILISSIETENPEPTFLLWKYYNLCKNETVYDKVNLFGTSMVSYKMRLIKSVQCLTFLKSTYFLICEISL